MVAWALLVVAFPQTDKTLLHSELRLPVEVGETQKCKFLEVPPKSLVPPAARVVERVILPILSKLELLARDIVVEETGVAAVQTLAVVAQATRESLPHLTEGPETAEPEE